jgi:thiol-disulfide isomerase/thioredoxin
MHSKTALWLTIASAGLLPNQVAQASQDATSGDASKAESSFKIGAQAPDFTLLDQDGKSHTLSDYRGKLVLLDWWGMWCKPCVASLPHVQAMQEKYANNPKVVILAMNVLDDNDRLASWWKTKEYTFPTLHDADALSRAHRINGFPTSTLIGPDGTVLRHGMGAAHEYGADVEKALHDLAAGKPIELAAKPSHGAGPGLPPMPESIAELNAEARRMFPIKEGHKKLSLLAGTWEIDRSFYLMGEQGPKLTAKGRVTYEPAGSDRFLVGRTETEGDPEVAHFVLGYDSLAREYYLHQYSSVNPRPLLWKGTWDEDAQTLTFTHSPDLEGEGGMMPDPEAGENSDHGDGLPGGDAFGGEPGEGMPSMPSGGMLMQPTLKMVIAFDAGDLYTVRTTMSFDPPPGFPASPGMGGDMLASEVLARRSK